jgi:hypothetical protein
MTGPNSDIFNITVGSSQPDRDMILSLLDIKLMLIGKAYHCCLSIDLYRVNFETEFRPSMVLE